MQWYGRKYNFPVISSRFGSISVPPCAITSQEEQPCQGSVAQRGPALVLCHLCHFCHLCHPCNPPGMTLPGQECGPGSLLHSCNFHLQFCSRLPPPQPFGGCRMTRKCCQLQMGTTNEILMRKRQKKATRFPFPPTLSRCGVRDGHR